MPAKPGSINDKRAPRRGLSGRLETSATRKVIPKPIFLGTHSSARSLEIVLSMPALMSMRIYLVRILVIVWHSFVRNFLFRSFLFASFSLKVDIFDWMLLSSRDWCRSDVNRTNIFHPFSSLIA